jgi:small subunit ribosomal protein S15
LMTKRIESLTEHFKIHKKDFGSRRGLLMLVGQRRRLLDYLQHINLNKYRELIKELGIRK